MRKGTLYLSFLSAILIMTSSVNVYALTKLSAISSGQAGLSAVASAQAGRTYPIAEQDMLTEIQQRAKQINKVKLIKKLKKALYNYTPKGAAILTPALKSKSYLVDMTYKLTFTIPRTNRQGKIIGVLYPKGYTFNPLRYMPVGKIIPTLVIFDVSNAAQTAYIKKHYLYKLNTDLITTKTRFKKILAFEKQTKTALFELTDHVSKRLHLQNTISIVYRSKNRPIYMRVDVIGAEIYQ